MLALIIVALVIWAVIALLGFFIRGLLWLAVIGLVLFVTTIIFGMIRWALSRKH